MIDSAAQTMFRELVEGAKNFSLTTHINPDGDAVGSQIGLARFLTSRGKSVRLINQDPTPEILRFVEQAGPSVETYRGDTHDAVLRASDLIVLVDNSAPDRLGRMEEIMLELAPQTLCIDHHPSRNPPWARQILDESACATAVMIHMLVRASGWTPDPPAAQAIFVGLATDTGFFRFNSTSPEAHEVAAELLRLGVGPADLYQRIFERNSLALTRLMGHALAGVQLFAGGSVASVQITCKLIDELDAADVDTSEITTALLAMDGIGVALLFRELPDGRVKVSLRSKGVFDVHSLAAEFGGGGHRNASGIVLQGDLESTARCVTQRAEALLAAGPSL